MQELFRSLNITRFSAGVVAQLDSGEIGCNRADVLQISRLKKNKTEAKLAGVFQNIWNTKCFH